MLSGFHSRGYLPHISVEGAAYFVTFRLADSLPREVILRLKEQRDDLLHHAAKHQQGDRDQVRRQPFAWYAAEVDCVLDQHAGAAWLRRPQIAELVTNVLSHFDNERYQLHAWCVVPNHVHAVVRPCGGHSLESVLHSWKSYTANKANQVLGRVGKSFWQTESYDHWVRDDADLAHCCRYTEENPVKGRLVARAAEWPWSSAAGT